MDDVRHREDGANSTGCMKNWRSCADASDWAFMNVAPMYPLMAPEHSMSPRVVTGRGRLSGVPSADGVGRAPGESPATRSCEFVKEHLE